MRWPWTRPDEQQEDESRLTDDARVSLHSLIGRLEQVVDRLEDVTEDKGGTAAGRE